MRHLRLHVGNESIFPGHEIVPECLRLFIHELDGHDRFRALEPVFPRYHEPHGRAVLLRQFVAIDTRGDEREFVHRFIHPQPLLVGPRPLGVVELSGRLVRVDERIELHVGGVGPGFHGVDQRLHRKPRPGNGHGPRLHAAQAVEPLLQRESPGDPVVIQGQRVPHQPLDLQRPGVRHEILRLFLDPGFSAAELVIIVVAPGNRFVGQVAVQFRERRIRLCRVRRLNLFFLLLFFLLLIRVGGDWFRFERLEYPLAPAPHQHARRANRTRRLQELPPVHVHVFRRGLLFRNSPPLRDHDICHISPLTVIDCD